MRCCGYDVVVHLRAEDVAGQQPPLSSWRHGGQVSVEVLENLRFAVRSFRPYRDAEPSQRSEVFLFPQPLQCGFDAKPNDLAPFEDSFQRWAHKLQAQVRAHVCVQRPTLAGLALCFFQRDIARTLPG